MVGFLKIDEHKGDGLLKPSGTYVASTWHLRDMSGLQESWYGNIFHPMPNHNQRKSLQGKDPIKYEY